MKRLIFCFDGTWNKLDPDLATNVVLTAASIERLGSDGVDQLIHYDEGVGTSEYEKITGGVFGRGVTENIREAYRFLIFNYDPGDQIYVFGFSRGAFSARSFVGLIRQVGPIDRLHAGRIDEAMDLYREKEDTPSNVSKRQKFRADYAVGVCVSDDDDAYRCTNVRNYTPGSAPPMRIAYLGIWDTVGAMGWPNIVTRFGIDHWLNQEHDFHDVSIDGFVESVRHAVAIDEERKLFPLISIGDVSELNRAVGDEPAAPDARYQERWFPGVHGAVGGGGDIRGLSDGALAWVLQGAKHAGLKLDTNAGTRIHSFRPDPYAPLDNETDASFSVTDLIEKDREGPDHIWQLSPAAIRRWRAPAERMKEGAYRPDVLRDVAEELDALPELDFVAPTDLLDEVVVEPRKTLSHYAFKYYRNNNMWPVIFDANRDALDSPDEIFPGQVLRIPRLNLAEKAAPSRG